jgi:hypothetical protein
MADRQVIIGLTDSVFNPTSAVLTSATALAANGGSAGGRGGFFIQNQGTNQLYVLLGAGCSSSQYHLILKACSQAADGTGGSFSMMEGMVYRGIVTVAGTSPSYTVLEV